MASPIFGMCSTTMETLISTSRSPRFCGGESPDSPRGIPFRARPTYRASSGLPGRRPGVPSTCFARQASSTPCRERARSSAPRMRRHASRGKSRCISRSPWISQIRSRRGSFNHGGRFLAKRRCSSSTRSPGKPYVEPWHFSGSRAGSTPSPSVAATCPPRSHGLRIEPTRLLVSKRLAFVDARSRRTNPLYFQIVDIIQDHICAGQLRVGAPVPSEARLKVGFGIAHSK